ncbi:MAG: hypothetical protein IJ231_09925 [Clostridia bacterium]|nr:hypothetical protein [Clostridia bacterium]
MILTDGVDEGSLGRRAADRAAEAMVGAYQGLKPGEPLERQTMQILGSAHRAVQALNEELLEQGTMTTGASVGCVMSRGGRWSFCSVGSIRILLYREKVLLQLNRDFLLSTEVESRDLLAGKESEIEPEWRKQVTAYAGMESLRKLDWAGELLELRPGDRVLMMSASLYEAIPEAEWSWIMNAGAPQTVADQAMERAKALCPDVRGNESVAILQAGDGV